MSDVRFCACVEGLLRGRKATCAGEGGGAFHAFIRNQEMLAMESATRRVSRERCIVEERMSSEQWSEERSDAVGLL
jgi:hypothetical protein